MAGLAKLDLEARLKPPMPPEYVPPGWLSLFEAYHRTGQALHGERWTKKEFLALSSEEVALYRERPEKLKRQADENLRELEDSKTKAGREALIKALKRSAMKPATPNLKISNRGIVHRKMSASNSRQETSGEKIKRLINEWGEPFRKTIAEATAALEKIPGTDNAAAKRHEEVWGRLRGLLCTTLRASAVASNSGELFPVLVGLWRVDAANEMLRTGQIVATGSYLPPGSWVVIKEQNLVAAMSGALCNGEADTPPPVQPRQGGGPALAPNVEKAVEIPADQAHEATGDDITDTADETRPTTVAARTKTQRWLERLMKVDGKTTAPEKNKDEYRAEAKKLFKVSGRGFNNAWADAIKATGATKWSKSGPRKG